MGLLLIVGVVSRLVRFDIGRVSDVVLVSYIVVSVNGIGDIFMFWVSMIIMGVMIIVVVLSDRNMVFIMVRMIMSIYSMMMWF